MSEDFRKNKLLSLEILFRNILKSSNIFSGLCLILLAFYYFFSEKINVAEGLGMDGELFGRAAQNLYAIFPSIKHQYLSGLLPSFLIHHAFRLFNIELSVPNIIDGFICLNLISVGIISYLWNSIAEEMKISPQGKILATIALLINFPILKWIGYYPVFTDNLAFCTGACSLYFYLKNKPLGIFLIVLSTSTTMLGFFIISHIMYFGTILVASVLKCSAITDIIAKFEWGLIFFFILAIIFSLDSESGPLIMLLPFIVAMTIKELDRFSLNWLDISIFLMISLLLSKIWINISDIPERNTLFYMNIGPFITSNIYYIHTMICLMLSLIMWKILKRIPLKNISSEGMSNVI